MTDNNRLNIVQKILDAYAVGDPGPLFAALAEDVTMRLTIAPGTPLSGLFHGAEGIMDYFQRNGETVETNSMEVLNILAGGDQVAVTGRESLTIKKSGVKLIDADWVMLYTFAGEKISSILLVENTTEISNAFGT